MVVLFISIYLMSFIIHLIVCYKENKLHIFYVRDLLDEIEAYMWLPVLNTVLLLLLLLFRIIAWVAIGLKVPTLWEKFRNIKLK